MLTLGAAAPHAHQMVTEHDFAPGNAGIIFDMDILIPLFGLLLLWLRHRVGVLKPEKGRRHGFLRQTIGATFSSSRADGHRRGRVMVRRVS